MSISVAIGVVCGGVALTQPEVSPPGAGAYVARVVREVEARQAMSVVEGLAAFGTRHTLSETASGSRGIGAAREWLKRRLEAISAESGGRLEVFFEEFDQPATTRLPDGARIVNVVAVLPGAMPEAAGRRYYVVGHYDSRNGDAMDAGGDAPGANDDASGVAVVIEAARVLSKEPLESTIVFLCTAGEEQGLLGAAYHASQAAGRNEDIRGVLNNDIVGDPTGPNDPVGKPVAARHKVRVFSEGLPRAASAEVLAAIRANSAEDDSPSRQLARYVASVAEGVRSPVLPMLVFRPDRFLRGGDHLAFNGAGFAAVRFTTVHEHYDRQHQNVTRRQGRPYGDVVEFVDADYLAGVTRLNVAALIHLANAPSPPGRARVLTAELANDTTIRWEKSPEPDVAGYEVVWRETSSRTWDYVKDVGDVTEARLPLSKDNVFFGVRAYDADGYRSPVVFPMAARQ